MTASQETAARFEADGVEMIGVAHIPEQSNGVGVLVVPGAPQYRVGPHRLFVDIARHAAARGVTVLRIDRRGFGDAPGPEKQFEDAAAEISAGLDALAESDPRVRRFVVLGLCDGASAALLHATHSASVKGLILLNPWVSTEQGRARATFKGYYLPGLARWRRWLAVASSYAHLRSALKNVTRALIASLRPVSHDGPLRQFMVDMLDNWISYPGRTLVILSGRDIDASAFDDFVSQTIGWGPLTDVSATTVERLRQADHTFTNRETREALLNAIADWLSDTGRGTA